MIQERPPAVAGTFYPGQAAALERLVSDLLAEAPTPPQGGNAPKALIAPHAGFMYSGSVAAAAFARLAPARDRIRRVVLLGPAHYVPFRGLAVSGAAAFRTPLGSIPVDPAAVRTALALPGVRTLDPAHEREHSLETQLPFLQLALEEVSLVPLVVGQADDGEVAAVLEALWGGPETLVVVSSDLSHFLDQGSARERDARTARAIEGRSPEAVGREDACGFLPLRGLLRIAGERAARIETLSLATSGDTRGPVERVVGYGAFSLEETA